MANGQRLSSKGYDQEVIKIQGANHILLPLGGCDIVLGVQWLKILRPIKWDFTHLSMQFVVEENDLSLKCIDSSGVEIKFELKFLKSFFVRQQGLVLQIVLMQTQPIKNLLPVEVQQVLNHFKTIFIERFGYLLNEVVIIKYLSKKAPNLWQ